MAQLQQHLPPKSPGPENEIEVLRRENDALAGQVKELVKAEGRLYRYQEQLDAQLHEAQELYRFYRELTPSLELADVFALSGEFIVNNLDYERVVFLYLDPKDDRYKIRAVEGYYRSDEADAVAVLDIACRDPLLSPLHDRERFLLCCPGHTTSELELLGGRLRMNEYFLHPLGSEIPPRALLVVGNSSEKAPFCRRVDDSEAALAGIGNLAELLSTVIENHILLENTKKALEQERLAEAKYRGIFENAMEGIFRTVPEGKFMSCNPALAEILGYSSPEEAMASITDLAGQIYADPEERSWLIGELTQGRAVKDHEFQILRKDGEKRWARITARPALAEDGMLLFVDGTLEDVSDRKAAEAERERLNEELEVRVVERTRELEEANHELVQISTELQSAYVDLKHTHTRMLQQEKMASIGQLAAGVAHEINNPMGFISSNLSTLGKYVDRFLEFMAVAERAVNDGSGAEAVAADRKRLKIDYLAGDAKDLIRESLDGAGRVRRIVQDLKSFSRVDQAEYSVVNLNEILETTINIAWNEIKYVSTLKREFGEIPPITCYPQQLNQVFLNLLVNAAQAMEGGGEITVRTWHDGDHLFVSVSDTGSGIPEEIRPRLFEPFFTTKEVGRGTGLGLSISYGIVKNHGGEIRVESEVGHGSCFTVILPIQAPPAKGQP